MQEKNKFENNILNVFLKKQRPVLLGEISLDCGQSIEEVEKLMSDLEQRGAVVQLTISETFVRGYDSKTLLFKLVDPSKFTKAQELC